MAEEIDKVEIQIVLDDGSIQKGFVNVKKQGQNAGKSLQQSFGKSFAKVGASVVALGAAVGAAFAGRKIIAAAKRQEEAVNRFETALLTSGRAAEFSSKGFQEFASSLQTVTRFGDEATLEAAGLIQSLGQLNQEGLERSTAAAQDLAAALGIDLTAAATLVGKAAAGDVGSFSRYGLSVKKAATDTETLANALTAIEGKFGGAAREQVKTFGGAIEQLENNFGDLQEELGFVITKNPVVIKTINALSKKFGELGKSVSEAVADGTLKGIIINLLEFGEAINTLFLLPLEIAFNAVKVLIDGFRVGFQAFVGTIAGIASGLVGFFAPNSELATTLKTFKEATDEVFTDLVATTNESLGKIGDSGVSDTISENLIIFKERLAADAEGIGEPLVAQAAAVNEKIGKIVFTAAENSKKLGLGLGAAFKSVGKALASGENAFEAFGKSVLSSFGGFLIELGQAAILVGVGANAVKASIVDLTGASAIAAGAALIVAGSAFQAIGGGGGGASTAATDGGGVAGGNVEAGSNVSLGQLEETPQGKGQEVNVSVTGNLVDPVGAAQAIAELLNDGARGEGLVVNV